MFKEEVIQMKMYKAVALYKGEYWSIASLIFTLNKYAKVPQHFTYPAKGTIKSAKTGINGKEGLYFFDTIIGCKEFVDFVKGGINIYNKKDKIRILLNKIKYFILEAEIDKEDIIGTGNKCGSDYVRVTKANVLKVYHI